MEKVYLTEEQCCGCTACANACPKQAITMQEDKKGFLYPVIDSEKCIDCGLCVRACRHSERLYQKEEPSAIYAVQHSNKSVVKESSSGGAFTLISDLILAQGGEVFGCVIDENFHVLHVSAKTAAERDRMRGSKYVQSDLGNVYAEIKQACKNHPVLFVGTPCQVGGLYSYLGKIPENLVTMDFICHGTPSQKIFQEHIRFLEKKYRKQASSYKFRDKKYGWRHVETVFFKDGSQKSSYAVFGIKHFFGQNINLRPACYACPYTTVSREADITIGDFWGAERILNRYENKGISLLMVNNQKGEALFGKITKDHVVRQIEVKDAMQRAMQKPAPKSKQTQAFWALYEKEGYEGVVRKYRPSRWKHILRFGFVALTVRLGLDATINKIKAKIRGRK